MKYGTHHEAIVEEAQEDDTDYGSKNGDDQRDDSQESHELSREFKLRSPVQPRKEERSTGGRREDTCDTCFQSLPCVTSFRVTLTERIFLCFLLFGAGSEKGYNYYMGIA
eukprot:1361330-Amorphochlora_amoeboformis.AAC.2